MISFKQGVKVAGIRPEIALVINVADGIYDSYGYDCIVTSVMDGKHSYGSLHFQGSAVDLRIRHLTDEDRDAIVADLKDAVTDEYDVVLEKDHTHIEFQPKN